MSHIRKQIRDAATTLVTGLATTGANVSNGRTHPLNDAALPALCVYARSDSADYEGNTATMGPQSPDRALNLRIQGFVRSTVAAPPDNTLDQIAAEVETAIYTDPTFGGLAIETQIGETEITIDGEGDQAFGVIDLGFNVTYRTVEGLPETAA